MPREKSPVTLGIDPGTFRLVAQCLNHYATPGPMTFPKSKEITCIDKLLLQHGLTEQRINIYHVTHILQFWLSLTFTVMILFEPV